MRKYLPFSKRKDLLFFLNFEEKSLEHIANDLLYYELCREVADAPEEKSDEDTNIESRILKDLSMNHDTIGYEMRELEK